MFEIDMCFGLGRTLECIVLTTGPTVADSLAGRYSYFSAARRAVLPFADPRVKRLESGGAQGRSTPGGAHSFRICVFCGGDLLVQDLKNQNFR